MSTSFTMLEKLSIITILHKFSIRCFLSSPSGTPIKQKLIHLKLSKKLLNYSHSFWFRCFLFPYLPNLSVPLLHPQYWCWPVMCSSFQLLHSSFLTSSFLCFLLLLKFSLSSATLPISLLTILISSVLNYASSRLIVFILFSSSEVLFCSFIWDMSVSSFWLSPYVPFCVLGRTALSPGLDRMTSCSRCPMGVKWHNIPIHLT